MSQGLYFHLTRSALKPSLFSTRPLRYTHSSGKINGGRHLLTYAVREILAGIQSLGQDKPRPLGARQAAVSSASSHHAGLCPSETYCQLYFSLSFPAVCTRSYPELKYPPQRYF